jgi:hypothetical protein
MKEFDERIKLRESTKKENVPFFIQDLLNRAGGYAPLRSATLSKKLIVNNILIVRILAELEINM